MNIKNNPEGLYAMRDKYERGLAVFSEFSANGAVFVIAKSASGSYWLLRYFLLGDKWMASADESNVDAEAIFKALGRVLG